MKQVRQSLSFLWVSILILGFYSCAGTPKDIVPSAEYAPYVTAYTGGVISQTSSVRIELTQEQSMVDLNNELKENPFSFSPSLKGKAYWVNNNTIEFVPEEGQLKPGKLYEASFQLGDFVKVDSKLKEFNFSFRVQERNFTLYTEPINITASQPDVANIKGEIHFSDAVAKEQVEQMFTVTADNGQKYPVKITATDNPAKYQFAINSISKAKQDFTLEIKVQGKAVNIEREQVEKITIPAKDAFQFLSARRIEQPENGIEVVFSEPLSESQDLKGLIEIPEITNYIFQIKDNKVNIYFEAGQLNKATLNINEGIKNLKDKRLGTSHSISFSEMNLKPQVEMPVEGAILPDSKNLIIPFRAVNLYAVDLSVIRIYENNILGFMQSNSLASASELRRFGRLIYKKTLWLSKDASKDVHKWEDYSIDLAGLIQQEPGAIYRIVLSFKQEYSAYPCGGGEQEKAISFADDGPSLTKVSSGITDEEEEAWDIPNSYYYYTGNEPINWNDYNWQERDNPCHPSYYMQSSEQPLAMCWLLIWE
ncbi:hypothetical protein JCM10512_1310 [Bacteroides reticulotermitis JCM 10512]|uniref:Uncharacterized protein n=1 Tax=Bacteroides reticulotermitis JCM 10512 TaxID=1445607 RepID=W4URC0_9BACE|nr:hypothetical protein JCM10512_1310 [Bacteroides reticulotermitis JCM 10512]